MRSLICTNHLQGYTGSEIVAIEIAEYLQQAGHEVKIAANHISQKLRHQLTTSGHILAHPSEIGDWPYEFVWSQHHIFPLLNPSRRSVAFNVFCHLSPTESLEAPAPLIEDLCADLVLANSPETFARLTELGLNADRIRIFSNPAPRAFQVGAANRGFQRLLVISNHVHSQILGALWVLHAQKGIEVRVIGIQGDYRRVLPSDLEWADAVLTIGKSVQYALAARRPVYCFDVFGGPGWLSADNIDTARARNFSGRCSPGAKMHDQIAVELVDGFATAHAFSSAFDLPDDFDLAIQMEKLLLAVQRSTALSHLSNQDDFQLRRITALSSLISPHKTELSADHAGPEDLAWQQSVSQIERQWSAALLNAVGSASDEALHARLNNAVDQAAKWSGGIPISLPMPPAGSDDIQPRPGTTVTWNQSVLEITTTTSDPGILWKPPLPEGGTNFALVIGMDVEMDNTSAYMQIFYRYEWFQDYVEKRSLARPLLPGTNMLSFVINRRHLEGILRIDPCHVFSTSRIWHLSLTRLPELD